MKKEELKSQDEVVEKRIRDIETGSVAGKTKRDYNEYLKRRGIACEN